jgi:hypothetical protein
VLKINQQYIASAAQDDKYRTEPSFKLQGSYRNMNKMTEKISAVMNENELLQMIEDHYLGEAQLLTTGAEGNLLKLAELRGNMTDEQQTRWSQIKKDFLRNKAMGGDDADAAGKVVAQLMALTEGLDSLAKLSSQPNETLQSGLAQLTTAVTGLQEKGSDSGEGLSKLSDGFGKLAKAITTNKPQVEVVNEPVQGLGKILDVLARTIEESIFPIMHTMDKKLEIDLRTHDRMKEITDQLRDLENTVNQKTVTRG